MSVAEIERCIVCNRDAVSRVKPFYLRYEDPDAEEKAMGMAHVPVCALHLVEAEGRMQIEDAEARAREAENDPED